MLEADNFRALFGLVAAGFGASVLPLAPLFSAVETGTLTAAPLVDPAPSRELVIATAADRPVSPATRFLSEAVIDVVADLVGRGIWAGEMLPRAKR